jgi:hypothetical protein
VCTESQSEFLPHQNNDVGRRVDSTGNRHSHSLPAAQIQASLSDLSQIAVGHHFEIGFQRTRFNYLLIAPRPIGLAKQNVISNRAVEQPRLLPSVGDCRVSTQAEPKKECEKAAAGEWRGNFPDFHMLRRRREIFNFISLVPLKAARFNLRFLQQSTDNRGFSASASAHNHRQDAFEGRFSINSAPRGFSIDFYLWEWRDCQSTNRSPHLRPPTRDEHP